MNHERNEMDSSNDFEMPERLQRKLLPNIKQSMYAETRPFYCRELTPEGITRISEKLVALRNFSELENFAKDMNKDRIKCALHLAWVALESIKHSPRFLDLTDDERWHPELDDNMEDALRGVLKMVNELIVNEQDFADW